MYGDACQEEITLNLGYSIGSQLAVWVVIINPISKFALDMVLMPIFSSLSHMRVFVACKHRHVSVSSGELRPVTLCIVIRAGPDCSRSRGTLL